MMGDMKKALGFEWNDENVWEAYKNDLQRFFDLLTEYRKARNELKKYVGKTLLKAVENKLPEEVFLGGIESEEGYAQFMVDAYGIGVDPEEFLKELNRPKESKSPKDFKEKLYEKINIKKFDCGFSSAIDVIYEDLINAGFKSNAKFRGDYKGVVEDIIKMFIHLSPLSNPKSFFINSLRHTPKFYVEKMYSNTEFIENYFRWSKWTNWKDLEDEYNLWNFESDSEWYHISAMVSNLYGCELSVDAGDGWKEWRFFPATSFSEIIKEYLGHSDPIEQYCRMYNNQLRYQPPWDDYISGLREKFINEAIAAGYHPEYHDILSNEYIGLKIYRSHKLKLEESVDVTDNVGGKIFLKYIAPQLFLGIARIFKMNTGYYIVFRV